MSTDRYQQSWQGKERAQQWESRADLVIPRRQEMFAILVELLAHANHAISPPPHTLQVIDLGAGTGSLAEKVLQHWPESRVVCIDNSTEMIEIGQEKLADYGDRVTWLKRDLADPAWPQGLDLPFDAVVSSLAIHLTPDEAKRRIYRWAYEATTPAGCFLSADRLKASAPAFDTLYHELWLKQIVRRTKEVLNKDVPLETVRERQRTMDAAAGLKCVTLEENLAWLREAGWPLVDCFWKDYQRAIFGAFKTP